MSSWKASDLFGLSIVGSLVIGAASHAGRHDGSIKPSMNERHDREQILGILLRHVPVKPRFVSGRVAKHAECPANEIGKAALLAAFAGRTPRVDRQHRRFSAEHAIDKD